MMSTSLDDIWDEPIVASPPHPRPPLTNDAGSPIRPSPAKRRRTALFLSSDSEDESQPAPKPSASHAAPKTPQKRVDIEALFDDIDDDAFQELAPALNVDALRREAAARLPPSTPHPVLPSSSPPRDFGEGEEEGGKKAAGKDREKEKDARKKARVKLDDQRLLDSNGFPALLKQAKHYKPRGKGHELSDLNRLMQIYQFWSHKLYPKQTFHANVLQIEKICHSKRMMAALSAWSDDFHGTIHGRKPEDLHSGDSENDDGNERDEAAAEREAAAPPASTRTALPSSSPPRPTSANHASALFDEEEDDFDMDAVIRDAEEHERQQTMQVTSAGVSSSVADSITLSESVTVSQAPSASQSSATRPSNDEDETMWDELGFDESLLATATQDLPLQPKTSTTVSASMAVDNDEDMWDVVRELEAEQQQQGAPRKPAPEDIQGAEGTERAGRGTAEVGALALDQQREEGAKDPIPRLGVKEARDPTNDEGWDEMYM